MRQISAHAASEIGKHAARVEASTGVQVLVVVAGKSDSYPEIPWKAFALGTALTALGAAVGRVAGAGGVLDSPLLLGAAPLGVGMVLALATVFLQRCARVFLGPERAAAEVRQHAQSLFLERGLSRTRSRRAVLVLVSCFERRAALVVDEGVLARIPAREIDAIAVAMDAALAAAGAPAALDQGLAGLEELLLERSFAAIEDGDEVADEFLETEGPKS